ncbi:T9SS type A sorting domain-containing protein [bacterium]|nr:T9SS type A sorting domain-containing protein [bacterium]
MFQRKTLKLVRHSVLILISIWVVVSVLNVSVYAHDRMLLVEIFANSGCPLCPQYIPPVQNELEESFDNFIFLQYHTWWPDNGDPWYWENYCRHFPEYDDIVTRVGWMERDQFMGVPSFFYDGHRIDFHEGNIVENTIDYVGERLQVETPLLIEIEAFAFADTLLTTVNVTSDGNISNLTLFLALCEREIEYEAESGQHRFTGNVLDLYPDGEGIRFSIVRNYVWTYETESPLNVGWCDNELENLQVVAWVQRRDMEILQSESVTIELLSVPKDLVSTPISTQFEAAYPNPFNSSVTIPFTLDHNGYILMTLHDLTGREIARVVDGEFQSGKNAISLDAVKYGLTNGIYNCRLISDNKIYSQKLVYLR